MKEPTIAVNGVTLTEGQAMTVRVALGAFAMDLHNDGLGDDEHGRTMTEGYLRCVDEVHALMFQHAKEGGGKP